MNHRGKGVTGSLDKMSSGWKKRKPGLKTHFFTVITQTKKQAYGHADRNYEMGLLLHDEMSDGVSERGVSQGGLFTRNA